MDMLDENLPEVNSEKINKLEAHTCISTELITCQSSHLTMLEL